MKENPSSEWHVLFKKSIHEVITLLWQYLRKKSPFVAYEDKRKKVRSHETARDFVFKEKFKSRFVAYETCSEKKKKKNVHINVPDYLDLKNIY